MANKINIDDKILQQLQEATCFGIAYSEDVPECKQCDVNGQCKAKTLGANIPTPDRKSAPVPTTKSVPVVSKEEVKTTPKKVSVPKASTVEKPQKPKIQVPDNMPDFKVMSMEELKEMADKQGVEWFEYGDERITRMRLIMTLKKQYM